MSDTEANAIKEFETLHALQDGGGQAAPPLLSIVIPTYNVEPYVRAAVDSALNQTLRDIEVIVVVDGATDGSLQVLEAMQKECDDPRMRIIWQENAGLSAARNTGILNARAPFIGFLDADDIWAPEKAALQVAMMREDSTIGISFSHSEYLTEDGRRTGSILIAGKARPSLHDMIRRNHVGNGSTPIVRQECFEMAGLFRPELRSCEDYEMWCRVLDLTPYRAQLLPKPLTYYRLRESSLSFNSAKFVENADRAIACIASTMPDVPAQVINAGHAEHYRIAAWKALSTGRRKDAFDLLKRALALHPALILTDWRALGTAFGLLLPEGVRTWLAAKAKEMQRNANASLAGPSIKNGLG
ncbi:glycosyltransferase family 2 protein [Methylocapsa palsarum]|uniref:Glycosyltransferase involved in cell wall bisynthesis n=1 Tax=Methylocapsa palsarum TaxID=1612308 RepID=A0A1I4C139_9HYPH|nr:glycosyltransferase family 2 protein [Methylocapsa palsarum]SFK74655.1 Glycosyltransferase involved in cell wall bisynthesis [Methylocapsa palsarum]